MEEKVHQEKLQGLQTRLTYGESSGRKIQFSESEACDIMKRPKKYRQSPVTSVWYKRDTYLVEPQGILRLRMKETKPTRPDRSHVDAKCSLRLDRESKMFSRGLGERKRTYNRGQRKPQAKEEKTLGSSFEAMLHVPASVSKKLKKNGTLLSASRKPYTQTEELYYLKNDHDQGGHWKSKKRGSNDDDDLFQPWLCEETDPFTARIRNFEVPKRTRMPANVKTYDGTGDPDDHLKIFQSAEK
ncbi:hypothetical protein Tco_0986442 [Tanacetum coccineum]